jgi:hypothetical protein
VDRLTICNLAIARTGVGSLHRMSDYEEDTEVGRNVRELYPFALEYVAREGGAGWGFLRTAAPGQLLSGTVGAFGFRYAYPVDAAVLLAVSNEGEDYDRVPMASRLSLAASEMARRYGGLATDLEGAYVWYIAIPQGGADIRDVGFCDAVAWLLARELAPALKADVRTWQAAQQAYLQALPVALAQSLNENRPGLPGLPASLQARG